MSIVADLTAAAQALLAGNVKMRKPGWVMNPGTVLYLRSLMNSAGDLEFPELALRNTLLGYPIFVTTQIPVNLTVSGRSNSTEIYLADFSEAVIFDAQLRIDVLAAGVFVDSAGVTHSAFAEDLTLLRIVRACDFTLKHLSGAACITGVTYHL